MDHKKLRGWERHNALFPKAEPNLDKKLKTYPNDSQSPIAKKFWKEVSEIRIDPFNRRRAIQLPHSNKVYKELNHRSYYKKEHLFSYATHREVSPTYWLQIKDAKRGEKEEDYLGDVVNDIPVQ